DRLPVASEETMQLGALTGLEVTYIARHDGRQPIRLASEIGRRLPASCTAIGKAALASLDPDEVSERLRGVESLPQLTGRSHRTVAALLDDIDEVRRRGYAIDDEETADGVICLGVAVPARRRGDGPYAASVTLLKVRADAAAEPLPVGARILAPIDTQEVWAAGVTYERSRDARMQESDEPSVYDKVYDAIRPELFFKAQGWRFRATEEPIGIRRDSGWD